jgi:hypothetical protein
MHCASWLPQVHRNGSVPYAHQLLCAALLPPDCRAVSPRLPEPMVQQDGASQNECERTAAKRLVARRRQDHPPRKFIVTDDSLRSTAPPRETLYAHALHDLLGGKEGEHALLFQQVQAAADAGRVPADARHDRAAGGTPRFRFVNAVPRNASNVDVRVNCIAYWELGAAKGQHCSWVTDWRVSTRTVDALRRGSRARWKIEKATFNPLKNQGDHVEHKYGHGTQNLSVLFAMLRRLAFLVDQTQQLCWALFQAVWAKRGSKRLLWERLRSLFSTYRLDSMRELFEALVYGFEQSRPLLTRDTSSSLPLSCHAG